MDRKELLKLLLIMAGADGELSNEEVGLLMDRAAHWGVDSRTLEAMVQDAAAGNLDVVIPVT